MRGGLYDAVVSPAPPSPVRFAPGGTRRALHMILAGTLVSSLGSGLTGPFLFVYLHAVRHIGLPVTGVVVAVASIVALAVGAAGGAVGDRVGVGSVLVFGMVLSALGTAAIALVRTPLTAALAIAGDLMGAALVWPGLNALIAALFTVPERPRAYAVRFGFLNAGFGTGALVSGLVVSLAHPGSFELIYAVDGATTLVAGLLVVGFLRSSPGFARVRGASPAHGAGAGSGGQAPETRRATAPSGYRAVLSDRAFRAFLACVLAFVLFGYAQLDGPWAAYATGSVHADPKVVGIAFAVNTAVIVAAQLAVTQLTRSWRRSRVLFAAGACWTVAWAVTALPVWHLAGGATRDAALVVSLGIYGLGETLWSPVRGAIPNELAPPQLRARYNALSSTVRGVGVLVGPPLAGALLGSGVPASWVDVTGAGMAVAALVGWSLSRFLPAHVERPPLGEEVPEAVACA